MKLSPAELGGKRAVLIAGPTASGKSAAARDLAGAIERQGRGAWIVNADSMQVYDALRVLTARPSEADAARIPHRLYGHVPAERRYSVGAWLDAVAAVLGDAERAGALAIVVGGTGLYFKALTEGLAALPPIPPDIRARWGERLQAEGIAALHAHLGDRDAAAAAAIRPSDAQRILRALEVLEATGRPLGAWQQEAALPLLPLDDSVAALVIEPERDGLYRRIEARFDAMAAGGAIEEVRALLQRGLDPALPAMKAIGVKEFAAFLRNEIRLETAVGQAKTATRRYAKRQMTWLRNQMPDWARVSL